MWQRRQVERQRQPLVAPLHAGRVRPDEQRGQPRPAASARQGAGPSMAVPACRSSRTHRSQRREFTASRCRWARRSLAATWDSTWTTSSRERRRAISAGIWSARASTARRAAFDCPRLASGRSHAPTARQIFTEVPWLQPMLDRLGLAADTPQQIADLLRTNAELSAYGYANSIHIDVTPDAHSRGRDRRLVGLRRAAARSSQRARSSTATSRSTAPRWAPCTRSSYSQRLDPATEVFLTWSALCHDRFFSSVLPARDVRVVAPDAERRGRASHAAPRPHRGHRLSG